MKFYLKFFDNLQNKPSYKFFINLFFLKQNQYFSIKQITHMHFFLNLKRYFRIKVLKFTYSYYVNVISTLTFINLFLQLIYFLFV